MTHVTTHMLGISKWCLSVLLWLCTVVWCKALEVAVFSPGRRVGTATERHVCSSLPHTLPHRDSLCSYPDSRRVSTQHCHSVLPPPPLGGFCQRGLTQRDGRAPETSKVPQGEKQSPHLLVLFFIPHRAQEAPLVQKQKEPTFCITQA